MLTDKFLRLQSFFFRLLGLELMQEQDLDPRRAICCILMVASFMPLTMAFGLRNIQNVEELTDSLCSILVDLLALCKIGFFLSLYEDFRPLIQRFHNMLQMESQWAPCEVIVSRHKRRDQFISALYSLCYGGWPLRLPDVSSLHVEQLPSNWPNATGVALSKYPWDNTRPLNYLVAYLWNVSAASGVALATVCVDTLFCSLTHNLCALFEIAQHKMLHFEGESPEVTWENLRHIYQLYGNCLDMGQSLNGYFRPLIFAQFLAASLHLCVLCYQLSANLMQPAMLFYAAFTTAILCQVSIYCLCGSSVNEECQRFDEAIYESNWLSLLEENPQVVRSLRMAMMRARRGCPFNGYFFEANRQTLVSIVRTAISYVTLLRSLV